MTGPLFILRCKQLGFTFADLKEMTIGFIYGIFNELENDSLEWGVKASQEDYDNF